MKVLISDYDGTLYVNENDIKNNSEKIEEFRKKGNMFIISTARNYSSIKEECIKNNIIVDYFFCDIGSVILDFEGNVIYEQHIGKEDVKKIEEKLENYKNKLIISRYGTNAKIEKELNEVIEYKIKGDMNYLVEVKNAIEKEIENVKTQITEDNRFIIHTSTKESAIEKFLLMTGSVKKEEIYTVGDELDDLEMLKRYNGYRMQNCNQFVRGNVDNEVKSVSQLIDIINN